MQEATTLISTVGFPIAACVAMFYMINKTLKEFKTVIENHTKAIEGNTTLIKEVLEILKSKFTKGD